MWRYDKQKGQRQGLLIVLILMTVAVALFFNSVADRERQSPQAVSVTYPNPELKAL